MPIGSKTLADFLAKQAYKPAKKGAVQDLSKLKYEAPMSRLAEEFMAVAPMAVRSSRVKDAAAAIETTKGWHGTGADFDKFDFKYMSEGSGGQMYGYGAYLGSQRKTGENYQKRLAKGATIRYKDESFSKWKSKQDPSVGNAISMGVMNKLGKKSAYEYIDDFGELSGSPLSKAEQKAEIDKFDFSAAKTKKGSHLYEVDIQAAEDAFMPQTTIDSMPKPLRDKLLGIKDNEGRIQFDGADTGEDVYRTISSGYISRDVRGEKAASEYLDSKGIPGRQWDGPSGKNFVVFNQNILKIAKKYGISVTAAAALLAGTTHSEIAGAKAPKKGK